MKTHARFLIPALCAGIISMVPAAEPKAPFTVRADHEDALYQKGQTATFTIALNPDVRRRTAR